MLGPVERVCPLLALNVDRRSVVDGVDPAHACHALEEPVPLERQLQAQLCLTPRHDRCERYLHHVARRGGTPGRAAVGDGLVSTRLMLAPEPAWRGIAGRARRGRPGRAFAVGGALVAAAAAGSVLAGPPLTGDITMLDPATPAASASAQALVAASPSADPAEVTSSASPSASPTPSAASSATPNATPVPSPAATPVVTATPEPARTYVVRQGDTLASIAAQFDTTVAALSAANGIDDADEIVIGQTLEIP